MCGFSGFLNHNSNYGDPVDLLRRMGGQLVHRGPDDSGTWFDKNSSVGLSHRRLSIIDLQPRSNQPFTSNKYHMIYNGEVYNYKELIREHSLKTETSSDTEVVLKMFQK